MTLWDSIIEVLMGVGPFLVSPPMLYIYSAISIVASVFLAIGFGMCVRAGVEDMDGYYFWWAALLAPVAICLFIFGMGLANFADKIR